MNTLDFPYYLPPFPEYNRVQRAVVPFLDKDVNIVASFATATGKSLLAECAFAFHLGTQQDTRVAYVCPFRSLGEEKFREWQANSQLSKFVVTISTGDHLASIDELLAGRLAILTAESFDSKLRNSGYADLAKSMSCVVFDECHVMGDRNGAIETALMRLTKLNPQARLILLSATLGNAQELAKWLKTLNGKPTKCFISNWRPVKVDVELHTVDDGYLPKVDKAVELLANQEGKTLVFVHSKVVGAEIVKKLRSVGVRAGFHNASISLGKRSKLEAAFANSNSGLNVLISTSTLASGVNL
jgi:helicase